MKFILAAALFGLISSSALATPTELCDQGTIFKRDCNTCRCNPKNGITRCTLMKCKGAVADKCPKGASFTRQCNTCRCDAKTGAIACTKMLCGPKNAKR